ncbi:MULTISPECIES: aminotransferase class V-fold PLP-dependent enzyme [Dickeya]|uniref:aminotransferase class V-fold PLP-dependent enzyme n=1 Tax=Dickeya TaxID=204037 RepID=UPI0002D63CE7|nr:MULTISPECIES: cysteine desulfurase [Dickeya]AJC67743.1 aminotransferase class V [Dickeya zeae EC1]
MSISFSTIRKDFPIMKKGIVYLDSAATSLKPDSVIERVNDFYQSFSANVGRSSHFMGQIATENYEDVRSKVASFIGCDSDEVVFTMNCTESINTIASSLNITNDDLVIISELEHHSNTLPWMKYGTVKSIPTDNNGLIDLNILESQLKKNKVKIVSCCMVSNVTGNIQPVNAIASLARKYGALCLIDGAQAVGHIHVDVKSIGCDFFAFSGHKMLGPSGVGVLYINSNINNKNLSIYKAGGGMVNSINLSHSVEYYSGHKKFEAGTPNIEGVLGLGSAIDYIESIGIDNIEKYGHELNSYLIESISSLSGVNLAFQLSKNRIPLLTLNFNSNIDLNFIARILSSQRKICVSTGYQCNQLIYKRRNLKGGMRISLHLYNSKDDIDALVASLNEVRCLIN